MTNSIFRFQISTEEDLLFQTVFNGVNPLPGRTLKVNVRERDTNVVKVTLVVPTHLTVVANSLTGRYSKSLMAGWRKGIEYEADIVDESGGSAKRIMAQRFIYDDPGNLVYGVVGTRAEVTWSNDGVAVVTAVGGVGPPGPANNITIGNVETLANGAPATARLDGAAPDQTLSLGLPRGDQGIGGTVEISDVHTGAPGTDATVSNIGTPQAAELVITIPRGDVGEQGYHGWSAVLAGVVDSGRRVHMLYDWIGGEGAKPPTTSGGNPLYIGPSGFTTNLASAVDVRGAPGAAVGPGSITTVELAAGAVHEVDVDGDFLATILRNDDLALITPRTSDVGATILSAGTTAQRPSPLAGYVRINLTTGEYEGGNGTAWVPLGGGGGIVSSSPPVNNLREGIIWFDRDWGAPFIYLIDDDGGQWVSMCPLIDPSAFFLKADALAGINAGAALTNLGFSAFMAGMRAAANAAAARAAFGFLWTPVGAARPSVAVAGIDMAIPANTGSIRLGGGVFLPANQLLSMAFSYDGGTTFSFGPTDYVYSYSFQQGPTVTGITGTNSSSMPVVLSCSNAALRRSPVDVKIIPGSAADTQCTRWSAESIGYGTDATSVKYHGYTAGTARPTHLRLFPSGGGNILVGTEIIMEASNG